MTTSYIGTSGNDTLVGTSSNDTFHGGGGSDSLFGGGGLDTATYDGVRLDYTLTAGLTNETTGPGYIYQVSGGPEGGTDTLTDIQRVQFVDGYVATSPTDTAGQVYRLYEATLNRAPDQAGLTNWVNALNSGATLQSVANGIVGSTEFQATYGDLDNTAFVTLLYNNVLHRAPDTAGIDSWVGLLNSGQDTRAQVVLGFSESQEDINASAPAVSQGLWVGNQDAAEVARLYDTVLGRLPDLSGLTSWTQQLENGTSLQSVADGFVGSAEFQAVYGNLNNSDFVTLLYHNVLHRDPDQAGLTNWVANLTSGQESRAQVVVGFSESAEHIANTAAHIDGGIALANATTSTSSIVSSISTGPLPTGPVATGPVVTVSNAQQLMAAMQSAQGGEVIKLAAGSYGDLAFSGMHFSGSGVTITSADTAHEAVVNSVALWGLSSGINLDHLTVQVPSTEQYGIQIDGASNLNFSNLTITGTGSVGAYNGTGILVRGGTDVSITHSDVSQLNVGISVVDSNNVTVSHNAVHDLSQDAIDSWGVNNEVISGNSITNLTPGDGVHPDAIQFAADPNGVVDSNILVADNVITRGTGSVFQGVFVENTNHIEITGNAMAGTMYNGISLSTTDSALVSNNFVEGFTDMTSWIITRNVSSNVSVTNNEATQTVNYADGGVANPNYVESGTTLISQANVGDYTALNAWIAQHSPSTASLSDSFFLH